MTGDVLQWIGSLWFVLPECDKIHISHYGIIGHKIVEKNGPSRKFRKYHVHSYTSFFFPPLTGEMKDTQLING